MHSISMIDIKHIQLQNIASTGLHVKVMQIYVDDYFQVAYLSYFCFS